MLITVVRKGDWYNTSDIHRVDGFPTEVFVQTRAHRKKVSKDRQATDIVPPKRDPSMISMNMG